MAVVTCDEVRGRLQKTSVEVPDAILNGVAFIPAGEAWLATNGVDFSALGSDAQILAKSAVIAFVCAKVVSSGPEPTGQWGPMKIQGVDANNQEKAKAGFIAEAQDYMEQLGVSVGPGWFYVGGQGTNEYNNEGEVLQDGFGEIWS